MKKIIFVIFFLCSVNFAQNPENNFAFDAVGDHAVTPNIKGGSNALSADELNNQAVEAALKNRYAEAVKLLRKAVEIEPNSIIIRRNLGIALYHLREYDEAIEILGQVRLKELPADVKTLNFLGESFFAVGKNEESLAVFQKALEIEPDNAVARYNYCSILQRLKRYDEAVRQYDRAAALDNKFAKAFNNRGMTRYLQGNYHKALADIQNALALDGSVPEIHNNLGVVLSHFGKRKAAHKYFLEAVRLRPDFNDAQFNLALSYQELGRRDEAFKHFLRLKELDANLAERLRKEITKQFILDAKQNEN